MPPIGSLISLPLTPSVSGAWSKERQRWRWNWNWLLYYALSTEGAYHRLEKRKKQKQNFVLTLKKSFQLGDFFLCVLLLSMQKQFETRTEKSRRERRSDFWSNLTHERQQQHTRRRRQDEQEDFLTFFVSFFVFDEMDDWHISRILFGSGVDEEMEKRLSATQKLIRKRCNKGRPFMAWGCQWDLWSTGHHRRHGLEVRIHLTVKRSHWGDYVQCHQKIWIA